MDLVETSSKLALKFLQSRDRRPCARAAAALRAARTCRERTRTQ